MCKKICTYNIYNINNTFLFNKIVWRANSTSTHVYCCYGNILKGSGAVIYFMPFSRHYSPAAVTEIFWPPFCPIRFEKGKSTRNKGSIIIPWLKTESKKMSAYLRKRNKFNIFVFVYNPQVMFKVSLVSCIIIIIFFYIR